jgi:hypothetical protein
VVSRVGLGGGRKGVAGGIVEEVAVVSGSDGAAAWGSGDGRDEELHGAMGKRF